MAFTCVAQLSAVAGEEMGLAREVAAAKALMDARKFAEARAAFERILAHTPDEPESNCTLALMACDAGEWEKALRLAAKPIARDPNHARYQYTWGSANGVAALKSGLFSKLGYARKCLAAYERAAELEPSNLQYRWALLSYYQQAPGFAGGDMAKAYAQAAAIKEIHAENGRQAYSHLYLAEKKYDLAFRQYEELLRAAPDDYVALYEFGRLTLRTEQRIEEGSAAFKRCLALTPPAGGDIPSHANVHWRLGNVWEKKNEPGKARAEYLIALELDPEFGPAKRALEKLGQVN